MVQELSNGGAGIFVFFFFFFVFEEILTAVYEVEVIVLGLT